MSQTTLHFTPRQQRFLQAYELHAGNVSEAAKAVGIPRRTVYNWFDTIPMFKDACRDADEQILDLAEAKLFEKIDAGSERAIIFYLRTKGRFRGYFE